MRWLTLALIALLVLVQYPLWLGKGGWLRVWDVDRQLQEHKEANRKLEVRNAGLDAEVRDLKQGYDAIEERARYELGMIKQDEVFVQILEKTQTDQKSAEPATVSVSRLGTEKPVIEAPASKTSASKTSPRSKEKTR